MNQAFKLLAITALSVLAQSAHADDVLRVRRLNVPTLSGYNAVVESVRFEGQENRRRTISLAKIDQSSIVEMGPSFEGRISNGYMSVDRIFSESATILRNGRLVNHRNEPVFAASIIEILDGSMDQESGRRRSLTQMTDVPSRGVSEITGPFAGENLDRHSLTDVEGRLFIRPSGAQTFSIPRSASVLVNVNGEPQRVDTVIVFQGAARRSSFVGHGDYLGSPGGRSGGFIGYDTRVVFGVRDGNSVIPKSVVRGTLANNVFEVREGSLAAPGRIAQLNIETGTLDIPGSPRVRLAAVTGPNRSDSRSIYAFQATEEAYSSALPTQNDFPQIRQRNARGGSCKNLFAGH